jgi:hypothetical protein
MPRYPWKEFLTEWSREIIGSKRFADFLTYPRNINPDDYVPDVMASGWLGYSGATEKQIVAAENRLGTSLPPDYREFLQVSNGWKWFDGLVPNIRLVQEITWYRESDADAINDWNDGWNYGRELYGGEEIHEQIYLPSTLRISDNEYAGTAVLLLNPQIVTNSGEWEAWYFAHWVPGADIHSSFWELVKQARSAQKLY